MPPLTLECLVTPPFGENTWFVRCETTRRLAVVDPGNGCEARLQQLLDDGYTCERIILTHAHLDHVWGLPATKQLCGAPVAMHAADAELYAHVPHQAAMFGLTGLAPMPPLEPLNFVDTGDVIPVGDTRWQVFHTPGHSPGHICLYCGDATLRRDGDGADWRLALDNDAASGGHCLVGDLVICHSVGRTDLPGGSEPQLLHSIFARLFALPPDTTLHAGHGDESTIAGEQRDNMVVGRSGSHAPRRR